MIVAIPLADATPHNAIELRYSLRSLEAVYGHFNLVIIGNDPPGWIKNIDLLPHHDAPFVIDKENNIRRKFYAACDAINEPFLWSNDDFFVNSTWTHENILCKGYLTGTFNDCRSAGYKFSINNTIKYIGHDWLDFDTHAPLWIDPKLAQKIDQWPQYGYLHKTLYMWHATSQINANRVFYVDFKFRHRPTAENMDFASKLLYFSSSNACLTKQFINWLQKMWPHKSRFE